MVLTSINFPLSGLVLNLIEPIPYTQTVSSQFYPLGLLHDQLSHHRMSQATLQTVSPISNGSLKAWRIEAT